MLSNIGEHVGVLPGVKFQCNILLYILLGLILYNKLLVHFPNCILYMGQNNNYFLANWTKILYQRLWVEFYQSTQTFGKNRNRSLHLQENSPTPLKLICQHIQSYF